MSRKLIITIITVLGLVVIGGVFFLRQQKPLTFSTAQVSRKNIESIVLASGEIGSATETDVFAKTTGTVSSLVVDEYQRVTEGQILTKLDAATALSTVSQAIAALESAKERKETLEKSRYSQTALQAAEALVNEKHQAWVYAEEKYNEDKLNKTNRQARDTAYTLYQQAEKALEDLKNSYPTDKDWRKADADISAAEAALADAQRNLANTVITAPQEGTILFNETTFGKISSNAAITAGQKLFTIANVSKLLFKAEIDETEIGKVQEGQGVSIELDAFPQKEFRGEVVSVEPKGHTNKSGGTAFTAKMSINLTEETARLGMNGDTQIKIEKRDNTLIVPIEAVEETAGKKYIYVLDRTKTVHKKEVATGLENDTEMEITSGASEGDTVVVENLDKLKEGMRIEIETP